MPEETALLVDKQPQEQEVRRQLRFWCLVSLGLTGGCEEVDDAGGYHKIKAMDSVGSDRPDWLRQECSVHKYRRCLLLQIGEPTQRAAPNQLGVSYGSWLLNHVREGESAVRPMVTPCPLVITLVRCPRTPQRPHLGSDGVAGGFRS